MPDNTYNDYGTPLTRAEAYLAQIAQNTDGDGSAEGIGNTYNDYGTPLTRAEALLATIMENTAGGGGGGSGGGVLVVHVDWDVGDGTLDKTWQEIHDAAFEQVIILASEQEGILEVCYLQHVTGGHGLYAVDFASNSDGSVDWMHFSADSASGYPVWYE